MAKSTALARYRFRPSFSPRVARPIVVRTTKIVKPKRKGHGHKVGRGDLFGGNRMKILGGAFALGMIQKMGIANNLPKIPLLGETGTIGLAAHFLGGGSRLAEDIATAAFTIAAFELGSTGNIVGAGDDGQTATNGYVAGF